MSGYAPVLIYSACGVDSLCHAMFFCFHRGINIWDREVENRVKFFFIFDGPTRFGIGCYAGKHLALHIFDARYPFAPHLTARSQQQRFVFSVYAFGKRREIVGFFQRNFGIIIIEVSIPVR